MSDNFIPLNQSTPVQGKWLQGKNHNQRGYSKNRYQNGANSRGGYHNRWGNNSRNSSLGSDSNNSFGQDKQTNIDAYLHPSMLQDPWAYLRKSNN